MDVDMLEARRSEKDFFSRHDLQYVDKVEFLSRQSRKKQRTYGYLMFLREKDRAGKIITDIEGYEKAFLETVELYKTKGLDETLGLQFEMRSAVAVVEENIKKQNNDQLMADMLTLRRNEKDYIMRQDVAYQTKLHDNEKILQNHLAASKLPDNVKADINAKLIVYTAAFDKIVDIDARIASKNGRIHNLRPCDRARNR